MAEKSSDAVATAASTTLPETISKTEAVRRSIEKLGKDAMPKAIQADIKERFGLEVKGDYVGRIKAEYLSKMKGPKKSPPKKSPPKKAQQPKVEPAPQQPVAEAKKVKQPAVMVEDVLTLKSLLHRVGADQLRTLISALEK